MTFRFRVLHFREEADEFVEIGALNGLFVLGRSIGFIGKLALRRISRCSLKIPRGVTDCL